MPKMKMPFGTMEIPQKSKDLIRRALDQGQVSQGRLVRELEERFARLMGTRHAVAVSTGTDADTLACAVVHDYGARPGDEVIVPALSFVATGSAVLQARLTPRFVDVDRATLNIDPGLIEAAVNERTRAIMPVHLMGKPAAMDSIMELAEKYGLIVIEDAAEAHGGSYRGRPLGSIGHMGAFSLYVAHIVSTIEGGMVTTNDEKMAEILLSLRAHGRACKCVECKLSSSQEYCDERFDTPDGEDIRFVFERVGYSSKMNELEAAVGIGNLDNFDGILENRRKNLLHVLKRFDRFSPYLSTITEEEGEFIGPHAIPLVINEEATFTRARFTGFLEKNGIETRTLFASMPTQCPGFAFLGNRLGEFPCAEFLGKNGLHVGVHQGLTIDHMEYFLETVEKFLEKHQD